MVSRTRGRRTVRGRTAARATARAPAAARAEQALPATMKAAALDRFGPPSVLMLRELPVPRIGPGEVLIEVHSAGVGSWDPWMREGSSGEAKKPSHLVLGTDGAGYVVARGERVRRLRVGDRVWAYEFMNPKGGFYAEYAAVKADDAAPLPEGMDLLEAGAGAATGLTALQGIDGALGVRPGERVLVFGASGSVGTLAVQFAKLRLAVVIATATGEEAAALVRRLGADDVIDARNVEEIERLRSLAPDGLDAVLALAGGDALERCIDLLRQGGRVAYPNGVEPAPRRRRGISVGGYDAIPGAREMARLNRAASEAKLRVPIPRAYPLAEAAEAHARVEEGHVLGRIALAVRGERAEGSGSRA